ncbi:family 1 glycosylhydrolase [Paenibacillus sp. FSL R10-2199]|uniref:family 1 glycosylhydrolase n=1 Tax=Paenibacillus sp. FSL R10-2199 TaxID=2975348 RepID=UPI001E30DDB5|nr:family 1 glycosylhydrolase [Paenibacillus sp. FSL P4-0081]
MEHYRDVLNCCHENSVTPIVTLHHFSSPKWLISEGGWESISTIDFFREYIHYVVSELGDLIPYICTINEANMGVQIKRIMEYFMSQKNSKNNPEYGDVQVGIRMDMSVMENYYRSVGEIVLSISVEGLPEAKLSIKWRLTVSQEIECSNCFTAKNKSFLGMAYSSSPSLGSASSGKRAGSINSLTAPLSL